MGERRATAKGSAEFEAGRRAGLEEAAGIVATHRQWIAERGDAETIAGKAALLDAYCIERRLRMA